LKQQISPWVAVGIIVVVVAIAGFVLYQKSGPGAHAKQAEDVIKSSVVGGSPAPTTTGAPGAAGTQGAARQPFIDGPPQPGSGGAGVIGGPPAGVGGGPGVIGGPPPSQGAPR
jgi:hypothetical protein